jgi:hypothetical protein
MPLKCFTTDWTHLGRSTEDLIETHPEATIDQFSPGTPCFCSHMEDESLNNGRKWSLVNVSDITYMFLLFLIMCISWIYTAHNTTVIGCGPGLAFKNREKPTGLATPKMRKCHEMSLSDRILWGQLGQLPNKKR